MLLDATSSRISRRAASPRRGFVPPRRLAPEVLQTSAMDCGPATLKCVLEGFGVPVSYPRLRELLQTDVDGTSIDTVEDVAQGLGLEVQQLVLPADVLLAREHGPLPAIVVKRLPNGHLHFVVVWSRVGGFVQVMDPHSGRSWVRPEALARELFLHDHPVDAATWRELAGTDVFLGPLTARLERLGLAGDAAGWLRSATADPTWWSLAVLDAAARLVALLVDAGGVRRGRDAASLLRTTIEEAGRQGTDPARVIPFECWSVWPHGDDLRAGEIMMHGSVLLKLERRAHASDPSAGRIVVAPRFAGLIEERPAGPSARLLGLLAADGLASFAPIPLLIGVIVGGLMVEALLLRGLFELGAELGAGWQRFAAAGAFVAFGVVLLLYEVSLAQAVQRMGAHLEMRLRLAFLRKIPLLGDRYFRTRLVSDLAERGHAVHGVRFMPSEGQRLLEAILELVATTVAIGLVDPRSLLSAVAAAMVAVVLPLLLRVPVAERDYRVRSHAGALGRYYLDALVGLLPVRSHGAERAVAREHEALLVEWARASQALQSVVLWQRLVQLVGGLGCVVWLVSGYVSRAGEPAAALLILYWALRLPVLAEQVVATATRYRASSNVALRLLEPLAATEEGTSAPFEPPAAPPPGSVAVRFDGVRVVEGGSVVLDEVTLGIDPGEHVAIVGRSGAGKSTLVGVLLGWSRPDRGVVRVDGAPLDAHSVHALRRRTAWVDPAIQLWNRSLLDNIRYGAAPADAAVGHAVSEAELLGVLERLPAGMQTSLGEGGALVSGGEGQRVRLARAMLRDDAGLVLLDEPFRGLDRARRRELLGRARRLWAGATLLCVTHDVGETRGFQRVLVIDAGRVVEDGAPAELAARDGSVYGRMLAAEEALRAELWSGSAWSRLRVERGRVVGSRGSSA